MLDPTTEETSQQNATLTLAYMPSFDEVCGIQQTGEMSFETQATARDNILSIFSTTGAAVTFRLAKGVKSIVPPPQISSDAVFNLF
jgi:exosome complex RNA-binding protein Rrp42 (RNase PH superfamily)